MHMKCLLAQLDSATGLQIAKAKAIAQVTLRSSWCHTHFQITDFFLISSPLFYCRFYQCQWHQEALSLAEVKSTGRKIGPSIINQANLQVFSQTFLEFCTAANLPPLPLLGDLLCYLYRGAKALSTVQCSFIPRLLCVGTQEPRYEAKINEKLSIIPQPCAN